MNQRLEFLTHPPLEPLAQQCLVHLKLEAGMLQQARQVLGEIHAALVDRDASALPAAALRQREMEGAMGDLAARRAALRADLAAALGVPADQANVCCLLDRLPAAEQELLRRWRRQVAQLAGEVDRMTRVNAALVQTRLALLEEVVACLTGASSSSSRYTACGGRERPAGGSLFEARC